MAVKDVHDPGAKKVTDVSGREIPISAAAEHYRARADAARARADAILAEREAAEASTGKREEPPFKVTGSVDIGHFNLQEQTNALKAEVTAQAKFAQAKIDELTQAKEQYKDAAIKAQIESIQIGLQNKIDLMVEVMKQQVQQTKPQSITEQIKELNDLASVLGFQKLDPGKGDITLQLEIIKLQNAEAHARREFEWQIEKDKRDWELRMKHQDSQTQIEFAKLKQGDERTALFASIPETIGRAAAAGFLHSKGEATDRPSHQPPGGTIEASPGEFGVVECPGCKDEVAFGPTARQAVCAGCGAHFPIKRKVTEGKGTDNGED